MEILAIGAHPDDVELGTGGLLIKAARRGHGVHIYTATRGSAGGDPMARVIEAQKSAKLIGAKNLWLDDLPDTRLREGIDLISRIESRIDMIHPDLILTHHVRDVHHDHRTLALATIEAARYESNILAYEIPLTRDFEPRTLFDISDTIDDKVELVNTFASQREKIYTRASAIRGLAEFRALQSRFHGSVTHVEAYDVAKLCLSSEFVLKRVPYQKPQVQKNQEAPRVELQTLV
ncbi:MAG: PIG-L family deacetylase [Nitrososphaerota archaeon]|nr:PIG-L family deacetylase [Nitrososphaerota archaeon]MDG6990689.1 PIG-L family deacetylase [Nitrososphaerota archaeon]